MSFSIPTYGPGAPFFTGDYALERPLPFTVTLDGRDYPIDLTKYRHNGLPKYREGVTTSGEPSDNLFDSQGGWWRYRYSWHLGAGQDITDLDADASTARFEASRGVDVWDEYQFCLLPATKEVLAATASEIHMIATSSFVYVADGSGLKRSADLVTWGAVTGLTGTINDLDTDGVNVYVATSAGVYTVGATLAATATSSASPAKGGFHSVRFAGNRLIVSDGPDIGELGPTTLDVFYTHYQTAFRWTATFQVGARIYVGGFAGNRSELFSVTTLPDGSLAISAEASSFFSGELLRAALSYGGVVILATSKGVRFATLAQDATLQYGALIELAGNSTCVTAEGRFAWFGIENFPEGAAGVGRLALDEFVAPLQPPYATDVFTEAHGPKVVTSVVRFEGRTVFAVSGEGVYATVNSEYVPAGWLDTGEITFGTVEDKSLTSLRVGFGPLTAGETVRVIVADGLNTTLGTGLAEIPGEVELELDLSGNEANRVKMHFELEQTDDDTPCVKYWRMRAYPIAPPVEEFLVPLIIQSRVMVNDGQGQAMSVDPWTATQRIRDRWENGTVVLYREGDHAWRVRIDNFQIDTVDWRDDSDWFEVVATVRLLTV